MAVPLRQRAQAQVEPAGRQPRTAWHRLRQHKLAMAGLAFIILLIIVAILAPVLAPADPNKQDLFARLAKPGTPFDELGEGKYWLGADQLGRDVLSRVIYGARISLLVGFVAEFIVLAIGVTLGALAGYYGGWVDRVIMRTADVLFAFPDLLFAIAVMFALGRGLLNLFVALSVVGWAGMARLARSQVLALKERDFVEGARAVGARDRRVLLAHILPNALGPIIVAVTLGIPGAIMSEASLSYLGLGVQPPTPTWGAMIYEGRSYLRHAPWMSLAPGAMIMLTVLAFNLLGDGLRDALDPRTGRRGG
ncbi:ABC transporter permease [Symbiobacterium terraclitae]|uniref:ABC transporter permease n=1 Tax=Symbiobacterium terraclitae TaxID=557451 RepID=UPI0035B53DD7